MEWLDSHDAAPSHIAAPYLTVGAIAGEHMSLRRILRALEQPGFEVVGVAYEIAELALEAEHDEIDVVVCHAGEDVGALSSTVAALRARLRDVRVIAVVRSSNARLLRRAMDADVDGIVLESQLQFMLPLAVRAASAGQVTFPGKARKPFRDTVLSYREKRVVSGVAAGLTNREIASKLHVSVSTVKGDLKSVFSKLGVGSRKEAVAASLEASTNFRGD